MNENLPEHSSRDFDLLHPPSTFVDLPLEPDRHRGKSIGSVGPGEDAHLKLSMNWDKEQEEKRERYRFATTPLQPGSTTNLEDALGSAL